MEEMLNLIFEPAPGSGSTTFEDRVVNFAESQGPLGERLERFFTDDNSYDGESVSFWQDAIRSLHAAWKLQLWLKGGLVHRIREQIIWAESKKQVLGFALPAPPGCEPGTFRFQLPVSVQDFQARLVGATAKRELLALGHSILNILMMDNSPTLMQRGRFLEGTLEIRLEPATLKDRLWHLLMEGVKLECYRQCSECSAWFDARHRDGKTLNSIYKNREYCGDRCKDRAKQRPLKRAWQLLQEGLALQAVADHPEVGLPLARVESLRDHQPAWLKRKAGPSRGGRGEPTNGTRGR